MASRIHRQPEPFGQQPRSRRKAAYIKVKNAIRRVAPVLGGKFVTHDYMHGKNNWLDAHFLGRKAPLVYSLAIQTTAAAYKEAVERRAWDSSYALVPNHDTWPDDRVIRDPKTGTISYLPYEPVRHPEFDGMTRIEWIKSRCEPIADGGEIQVHEEWTLHHDYVGGVGLHATIDVPFLTIDAVNDFIDRFMLLEADYRDPTPRSYTYQQIDHWGLDTNTVIDPWDWASVESKAEPGREESP